MKCSELGQWLAYASTRVCVCLQIQRQMYPTDQEVRISNLRVFQHNSFLGTKIARELDLHTSNGVFCYWAVKNELNCTIKQNEVPRVFKKPKKKQEISPFSHFFSGNVLKLLTPKFSTFSVRNIPANVNTSFDCKRLLVPLPPMMMAFAPWWTLFTPWDCVFFTEALFRCCGLFVKIILIGNFFYWRLLLSLQHHHHAFLKNAFSRFDVKERLHKDFQVCVCVWER